MAMRLPVRFLRVPFGLMAKDTRCCCCARLPLLPQAGALALLRLLRLLRWLLFICALLALTTKK
jgi:hypothetical protein